MNIAGQDFPEAQIVAAMYEQLLEAEGYTRRVPSSSARATSTWAGQFPESTSTSCRSTSAASSTSSTPPRTAPTPSRSTAGDADESVAAAGRPAGGRRASRCSTRPPAIDTNAFFVTQEFSDTEGVTTLSDLEGKSRRRWPRPRTARAAPTARAGLTDDYGIDVTEFLPLGFASADLQVGGRRRVAARPDLHHGRHPGVAGPGPARGRQGRSSRPRTSSRPSPRSCWPTTGTSRASSTTLMAALTTEKLTELNGQRLGRPGQAGGRRQGVPRVRGPALS